MRIHSIHFAIPSSDPERSFRFYVDGLLFRKVAEYPKFGLWGVGLGDFEIAFVHAEDASLVARPNSRFCLFSMRIDDIEDYYNRVRATGLVQIETELDYYPTQTWQFSIIDDNGYRIGFDQKAPVA
jgi:predicted enzyme related to lactoylglutathione lyase